MTNQTNTQYATSPALYPTTDASGKAEPLTDNDQYEALNFLSLRPVHAVILAGWIRDHGIVNPKHRGTFYGYRDENGDLAGVALIGRNLLFEAATQDAINAFAVCARDHNDIGMIFAEEEKLKIFWRHFRPEVSMPTPSQHQSITCSDSAPSEIENINEMRIATRDELDQIVACHAEMVMAETGVDPLVADADGFRMRCATRVDQGRVWVWMKDGELIFKTDIVSVTPEVVYIEGLWVNPKARGNRYSTRCLASMCRQLLSGSNTICGFLDADHPLSTSLYRNAGFKAVDTYSRIYL